LTCPQDCGACNYCGDGNCGDGETCSTCPQDCGACNYCGDGNCGDGETCTNCLSDCGQCVTPEVVRPEDLCTETDECVIIEDGTDTGSDEDWDGPSGAFVAGGADWFWVAVWVLVLLNLVLVAMLVIRKMKK
jgi:hypothetical protein